MNVEYKEKKAGTLLSTVETGSCFDHNGKLYIVVDADYYMPTDMPTGNTRNTVFAVHLASGEFVGLGAATEVTPVENAKVVVK